MVKGALQREWPRQKHTVFFSFIYHILYKDLHNNIIYSVSAYKHVQFIFPMCEYKPLYIMLFKDKKKKKEKREKKEMSIIIGKGIIMITRIKRNFLRSR